MKETIKGMELKISGLLKDSRKYDDLINRNEPFTLTNSVIQFNDKELFDMLITYILNEPSLLSEVLKQSYRHHNGFHKIVLNKGALFKLRLHIFTSIPAIDIPMENIHNHRWNFASQVIMGKLKMEIFQKSSDGQHLFFDHNYRPANGEIKYQVELLGLSRLQLIEERVFKAGESYYMNCEELHRIVNYPNEKVVTVVMTGAPTNNNCKLYSSNIFSEEQKHILPYSRNELVSILETIWF
jgi:hypothetical protein